ncbi:hypothetical protein [Candidatus Uabimicrobium sp. HlEnr_7]|uniref:hypothetical protein n=1 Tax=Candidatus Uabimicrobium helgolandensis TaxID=3095367 RepID=UPI0035582CBF
MKSLWAMCTLCMVSVAYLWAINDDTFTEEKQQIVPTTQDDCGCSPQPQIETCVTGCAAIPDTTPALTKKDFLRNLHLFANEPLSSKSLALETLLFYGEVTQNWLPETSVLDKEHLQFLQRELQKTHVEIQLRVVDEKGIVRIELEPTVVKIGDKYHQHVHKTQEIQSLEISGTIKRVGLYHLWSRF